VPCPMPATRTAARAAVRTTAAAPSEIGQQCSSRSGSATIRESSTSSIVTARRKWAYGFRSALAWFFTATWASSRGGTQRRANGGGELAAADEGLGVHRRDDDRVRPLEPSTTEGGVSGLGHEVGQRLAATTDARHARSGDPHVKHRSPSLPGRIAARQGDSEGGFAPPPLPPPRTRVGGRGPRPTAGGAGAGSAAE